MTNTKITTTINCQGREDCTNAASYLVAIQSELSPRMSKQVNVCSDHARAYTENLGYRILFGPLCGDSQTPMATTNKCQGHEYVNKHGLLFVNVCEHCGDRQYA